MGKPLTNKQLVAQAKRLQKALDKAYDIAGSVRDRASFVENDNEGELVKRYCNKTRDAITKLELWKLVDTLNGY